jgi:hypothetical protein
MLPKRLLAPSTQDHPAHLLRLVDRVVEQPRLPDARFTIEQQHWRPIAVDQSGDEVLLARPADERQSAWPSYW